jgi:hypothetical protein
MTPFRVAGGGPGFRLTGEKKIRVSGLSNRDPGTGYQVRVRVRVLNLYLVLNTRTRDLTAETWDLRMNHALSIHSGFRSPFERIESRQLGQHAVLTLPRDRL